MTKGPVILLLVVLYFYHFSSAQTAMFKWMSMFQTSVGVFRKEFQKISPFPWLYEKIYSKTSTEENA